MSPFPEEPLDSEVGYIPAKPEDKLDNDKYTVLGKLGWGARSSVWLVADNEDPDRILAAKVFTVEATEDGTAEEEKDLYEGLGGHHTDIPIFQGSFEHESSRGTHLVLLFVHIGPSVEALRLSNTDGGYIPVHFAKKIVARLASILSTLHSDHRIVHGGVKAENVLITSVFDASSIRSYLESSPFLPPSDFVKGELKEPFPVVKSQPLDHGFKWNSPRSSIAGADVYLTGLGSAAAGKNDNEFKTDIQDLGLLAFLLVTGTPLFPGNHDKVRANAETIGRVEELLTQSGKIAASDVPSTASFIRSCLKSALHELPSGFELLSNPWVEDGSLCSCGWCVTDPIDGILATKQTV
ncbi:kinase-like protein [Coprinopsis marcescibilis]|uniref:non-specific serine/threonine protein kinase n=1 Tax=Coprinopsis marcescibilis TaxID=230819 RepID=A0A5C3KCU5_COPMA|nr:kinase-like protein [Coprinopsis marcescibilis]